MGIQALLELWTVHSFISQDLNKTGKVLFCPCAGQKLVWQAEVKQCGKWGGKKAPIWPKLQTPCIRNSCRERWQVQWSHVSEHAQQMTYDKEYVPVCRKGLEDTCAVVPADLEWRRDVEGHLLFNLLTLGTQGWSRVTELQVSCRMGLLAVFSVIGPTEMKLGAHLALCWNDCGFLQLQLQILEEDGNACEQKAWMHGHCKALFERLLLWIVWLVLCIYYLVLLSHFQVQLYVGLAHKLNIPIETKGCS